MKKIATMAVVMLIFANIVIAKTARQELGIKGNAKHYVYEDFDVAIKFGRPELKLKKKTEYSFNENGSISQQIKYNGSGVLVEKRVFKYDDKGNILEEKIENCLASSIMKHSYKYNEKFKLVEVAFLTDSGIVITKTNYVYDEKGNLAEENIYDRGALNRKIIYMYDDRNLKVDASTYSADGVLSYKNIYKYDQNKRIVEDAYYQDGSLFKKETFRYDAKGNMIEDLKYNNRNWLYKGSKWTYNDKGQLIMENGKDDAEEENWDKYYLIRYTYDKNGLRVVEQKNRNTSQDKSLKYIAKYTYDKNGNQILDETSDENGVFYKAETVYDDYNNQTEYKGYKKVTANGQTVLVLFSVEKRTYSYYM